MTDCSGPHLEESGFCKEPFVNLKFGSYRGESQFQLDSANYSYSKMNTEEQIHSAQRLERREKGRKEK